MKGWSNLTGNHEKFIMNQIKNHVINPVLLLLSSKNRHDYNVQFVLIAI